MASFLAPDRASFKEAHVEISPSTNCLLLLSPWPQECMEGYTMNTRVYDVWWNTGQRFICRSHRGSRIRAVFHAEAVTSIFFFRIVKMLLFDMQDTCQVDAVESEVSNPTQMLSLPDHKWSGCVYSSYTWGVIVTTLTTFWINTWSWLIKLCGKKINKKMLWRSFVL